MTPGEDGRSPRLDPLEDVGHYGEEITMKALDLIVTMIVVCLLGDLATPLCPGAFRVDPAHSIQAIGASRAVAPVSPDLKAASPSLPQREVVQSRAARFPQGAAAAGVVIDPSRRWPPRSGDVAARSDPGSCERSEDG